MLPKAGRRVAEGVADALDATLLTSSRVEDVQGPASHVADPPAFDRPQGLELDVVGHVGEHAAVLADEQLLRDDDVRAAALDEHVGGEGAGVAGEGLDRLALIDAREPQRAELAVGRVVVPGKPRADEDRSVGREIERLDRDPLERTAEDERALESRRQVDELCAVPMGDPRVPPVPVLEVHRDQDVIVGMRDQLLDTRGAEQLDHAVVGHALDDHGVARADGEDSVASLVERSQVVEDGARSGRLEHGARALGQRSVLAAAERDDGHEGEREPR